MAFCILSARTQKVEVAQSLTRSYDSLYCVPNYRPHSRGDNTFGSVCVCVSVRLSVSTLCLNRLTFDLDFWHEGRPWPWIAWDCRSRSLVKGQGQTVKNCVLLPQEDFSAPPGPIPNYQPQSIGENTFGSAHPSICVFVYSLQFEPFVRH